MKRMTKSQPLVILYHTSFTALVFYLEGGGEYNTCQSNNVTLLRTQDWLLKVHFTIFTMFLLLSLLIFQNSK